MTLLELLDALRMVARRSKGAALTAEVKLITARADLGEDIVNGVDIAQSAIDDVEYVEYDPNTHLVCIHEGGPRKYP